MNQKESGGDRATQTVQLDYGRKAEKRGTTSTAKPYLPYCM